MERIRNGWVVCSRWGKRLNPICPIIHPRTLEYDSVSGYGELFYSKSHAESIAQELNDNWGKKDKFVAVQAKLIWNDEVSQ